MPPSNARRAARLIDLEHAIEPAQVEADGAGVGLADRRLDAADDRGAAAEGDDGDLRPARPLEHGRNVGFACRQGDEVGRVGEVAREGADRFRIGLAVGVQEPLVGVLRQDARKRGGRSDARRAERNVGLLRRRREAGLDAEAIGDEAAELVPLGIVKASVLETPAVELQPVPHVSIPTGGS